MGNSGRRLHLAYTCGGTHRPGAKAARRSRAANRFCPLFRRRFSGMRKRVRKAVFPVAGLGTRFLPATKANPKEMLPVVDKPLVQDRKSTRLNSSHVKISYAVFCL